MSVYRLLAVRYLLQRWDRAALIVVSIALGVATLVSARILNQCIEAAAQDTTTPGGSAELYVTNGEAGVLRSVTEELRDARIPGVKSVQPLIFDRVTLPDLDGRVAILVGAEVSTQLLRDDNPLRAKVEFKIDPFKPQFWALGAAFQEGDLKKVGTIWDHLPTLLVMLSKPIYDDWMLATGGKGPFIVRYATRNVECLPAGWVEFDSDSPLAPMGKNFIGMSLGQSLQVVRPTPPLAALGGGLGEVAVEVFFPAKVNRIDIFLEPDTDRDTVTAAVTKQLHHRADVRTPDAQRRSTQEVVSGLQIGVLTCSLGAMVVGLFLVYNAMAVTVAERRTDIGILRSLGATRWQIVALFAIAAAILGFAGALLGVPLGVLLAKGTLTQFRAELESMFLNPELNPARLTWSDAALAMLAGIATAVFAALVPAVQAANDDPAHVARRTASGAKGVWRLAHRVACAALVLTGVAMILLRHDLPPRVGGVGGMMTVLVGLLLGAPIFIGIAATLLQPLVRATCPFVIRLAFDNLSRAPGRTGVVIGALGAGVALMFQTAGVGRSNEEPVVAWISQVVQADHFVFSGNMTAASSSNSPMPSAVARELAALPGVEHVMSIRYSRPEYKGTIVYLIALDATEYARATRERVPTGMPDLEKFLALPGTNDVLVSENFLARQEANVGDTITLAGPRGPVRLRIVGAVRDYTWSRGTIFMDRSRYANLFGDDLIDMCHVFVNEEVPGSGAALQRYTTHRGLLATPRDSLRKFLSELISRIYVLAAMQQIVVGVVAALGVVTALLISVLQRKRELGLLLALGATPGQVMRSVLAEAFLMGVFGTALGILIGLPMEWYVLKVMFVDESGFNLDLLIPWKATLAIAAASITLATVAGLVPAWRAIQTRIPESLQYE